MRRDEADPEFWVVRRVSLEIVPFLAPWKYIALVKFCIRQFLTVVLNWLE